MQNILFRPESFGFIIYMYRDIRLTTTGNGSVRIHNNNTWSIRFFHRPGTCSPLGGSQFSLATPSTCCCQHAINSCANKVMMENNNNMWQQNSFKHNTMVSVHHESHTTLIIVLCADTVWVLYGVSKAPPPITDEKWAYGNSASLWFSKPFERV